MVDFILIGAGARGMDAYGRWIASHRKRARLVAVAEPNPARREACAAEHRIPPDRLFGGWEELLEGPRMAEACIVATQDRHHTAPALTALGAGYHVLLEKPMAPTEEECRRLVQAAQDADLELRICHVLRYTPFFSTLKRSIDRGEIGDVVVIDHSENVGYWHFAHSYVRGNWRKSAEANPLILSKACHDMDIMYWLAAARPRSIQSFGSLEFYRSENAPAGAPERCTDGCPLTDTCPWYAPRLYLHGKPILDTFLHSPSPLLRAAATIVGSPVANRLIDWREWPASTISDDHSRAARLEALRSGPYGRCVFRCDNDVVDRQSVNIEFESGAIGNFCVHGHSFEEGRRISVQGTRGCLEGSFGLAGAVLRRHDHRSGRTTTLLCRAGISGHGGGDAGIMEAFVNSLESRKAGGFSIDPLTSAQASLESHCMCFAAEHSRLDGSVTKL
jgi:predicted dehydrogenase